MLRVAHVLNSPGRGGVPRVVDALVRHADANRIAPHVFYMKASDGPDLMGVIGLERLDRDQSEVGYWVAPAFWNTGLASDAVQALVDANPMGNKTMFASVFQDNPASARVLTHCGFQYLGDAESYSVARDANVPTWTYSKKL